jgi:hypothetical protein
MTYYDGMKRRISVEKGEKIFHLNDCHFLDEEKLLDTLIIQIVRDTRISII